MNDALHVRVQAMLSAAPCSIELPAGTGKTHTLAAAVSVAAAQGERSLVLTHTHAGVDAIRRRVKDFGVPASMYRVETIASWAFSLTRSYASIAGVSIGPEPDWSQTNRYIAGAARVAEAVAIRQMLTDSFGYLFVDEYQDCTATLHSFVAALNRALPRTIVFGDPLQGIFGWDEPLANWQTDVLPLFAAHPLPHVPHRWVDHNRELGQWILDVRSRLLVGETLDFSKERVTGLTYVAGTSPDVVARVAHAFGPHETVVLLDKWPQDVAGHASRLGGAYVVMEEVAGSFMRRHLDLLPKENDPGLAAWLATFAKQCVTGLGRIDPPLIAKLEANRSIAHLSRPQLEVVIKTLERLRLRPSYGQLRESAEEIRSVAECRLYRWEAWHDTLAAIEMSEGNGLRPPLNLAVLRERLRRSGRRSHARIASRTLLVKGLEYDHVIVANLHKFSDPQNLYVALSRARKSITILGDRSAVTLQ